MQIAARRSPFLVIIVLFAVIMAMLMPFYTQASVQLGGWLSSKLFEITVAADSQIVFDRGQDTFIVFASAPVMTTSAATGATISGVTGAVDLNGNLDTLNVMPQADVGFIWGYAADALTNTTPTTTMNTTGTFTYHLTGYNPLKTVYYQAVGTSDGVAYGLGATFTTPKAIDDMTGFESIILITPLLLWVAALITSVVAFTIGVRSTDITSYVGIGIGVILLTVTILIFPTVIETINQIRLIPSS